MKHDESTHPAAHSAGAHPPAEEDRIQSRTIVYVGVGALVVFLLASVAAIAAMKRLQREIVPEGPPPYPQELGKSKIGMLEQRLFENSNQVQVMTAAQRDKLETWGWVDRERGVARMPIGRAMQLVVQGERPPAAPGAAEGQAQVGGGGPGSQPSLRPDVGRGGTQSGGPSPAGGPGQPPEPKATQRSPIGGVRR